MHYSTNIKTSDISRRADLFTLSLWNAALLVHRFYRKAGFFVDFLFISLIPRDVIIEMGGRRSRLLTGDGERGERGAKSDDCEKAWPSMNHSILSG